MTRASLRVIMISIDCVIWFHPPPYKKSRRIQGLHVEHLKRQSEYLMLIRDRHLGWMRETMDPKIRELHYRLAQELEQMLYEYAELVEALEN